MSPLESPRIGRSDAAGATGHGKKAIRCCQWGNARLADLIPQAMAWCDESYNFGREISDFEMNKSPACLREAFVAFGLCVM
uniref:Uncharacterized protein n=1 Tax=Rhizobium leguminosarum TaxID=384 RepID=A0A179BSJ4_RHILE|nr:hypothetical protein [Rhizobium leguminosarum]OAP94652.1 hypothetical protein A4U53_20675 [Rhizobium leguminosarum]